MTLQQVDVFQHNASSPTVCEPNSGFQSREDNAVGFELYLWFEILNFNYPAIPHYK